MESSNENMSFKIGEMVTYNNSVCSISKITQTVKGWVVYDAIDLVSGTEYHDLMVHHLGKPDVIEGQLDLLMPMMEEFDGELEFLPIDVRISSHPPA